MFCNALKFICLTGLLCFTFTASALAFNLQIKNNSARNLKVTLQDGSIHYLVYTPQVDINVPTGSPTAFKIEEISDIEELRGVQMIEYATRIKGLVDQSSNASLAVSSLLRTNLSGVHATSYAKIYNTLKAWEFDVLQRQVQGLTVDRYTEFSTMVVELKNQYPALSSNLERIRQRNGYYAAFIDHVREAGESSESMKKIFKYTAMEVSKAVALAVVPMVFDYLATRRSFWQADCIFDYQRQKNAAHSSWHTGSHTYQYLVDEHLKIHEVVLDFEAPASAQRQTELINESAYGLKIVYKHNGKPSVVRLLPINRSGRDYVPSSTTIASDESLEDMEVFAFDPRDSKSKRVFQSCSGLCKVAMGAGGVAAAALALPSGGVMPCLYWGIGASLSSISCYAGLANVYDVYESTKVAHLKISLANSTKKLVFSNAKGWLSSNIINTEEI